MPRKRVNFVRKAANRARKGFDSARESVEDAKDKTEDLIKENPWTSVAIAAGVGAIVALAVSALGRPERKSFARRVRDYF